jgi:hypothetical protein
MLLRKIGGGLGPQGFGLPLDALFFALLLLILPSAKLIDGVA